MEPIDDSTRPRTPWMRAATALALLGVVAVAFHLSGDAGHLPPDLKFDGTGYVEIAQQIRASGTIPTLELRPPLYPLLLVPIVGDGVSFELQPIVDVQRFACVASAALTFLALGAPIVGAVLIGIAPWYAYHAWTRGTAFSVKGANMSIVNNIGDRRLLGRFPASDIAVEDVHRRHFAARPEQPYVAWWETQHDLNVLARPETSGDWDRLHQFMGATARRVLVANPGYYAMRWLETWREFTTAREVIPGNDCPMRAVDPWWRRARSAIGVWLPFAILLGEAARWWRRGCTASGADLAPIAAYLSVGLLSTALEPWPGQARYRAPFEPLLLIATIAFVARGMPSRHGHGVHGG